MPAGQKQFDIAVVFSQLAREDRACERLMVTPEKRRGVVWGRIKAWETFHLALDKEAAVSKIPVQVSLRLIEWWLEYPTIDRRQEDNVKLLIGSLLQQFRSWYDVSFLNEGEVLDFHLDVLLLMRQVINTPPSLFSRPMQVNFFAKHVALLLPHVDKVVLLREQKLKLIELRSHLRSIHLPGDLITAIIYAVRNKLRSISLPSIPEENENERISQDPDVSRRHHSCPSLFPTKPVLPSIVRAGHENPLSLLPEKPLPLPALPSRSSSPSESKSPPPVGFFFSEPASSITASRLVGQHDCDSAPPVECLATARLC